ncbi:MAG: hypothetical protein IPJ71_17320 [Bdellovibrionales bacterium]|nr:hypothetical protein [Bdellovibrionales bacterium]
MLRAMTAEIVEYSECEIGARQISHHQGRHPFVKNSELSRVCQFSIVRTQSSGLVAIGRSLAALRSESEGNQFYFS